ncbi:hypothetical protein E1A91_D06G212100v1 [Gossypium mustelinum]|uniref:Uncharacterized protein n=1 Tax=Gossypium mustelinum TaxID=34275 RepID=A0A5D2UL58_GOSMU|nr:hypothetical protein E1A91_D06G212100v1 [Gossypium mustelinum]
MIRIMMTGEVDRSVVGMKRNLKGENKKEMRLTINIEVVEGMRSTMEAVGTEKGRKMIEGTKVMCGMDNRIILRKWHIMILGLVTEDRVEMTDIDVCGSGLAASMKWNHFKLSPGFSKAGVLISECCGN